jgi:hypothetical protein
LDTVKIAEHIFISLLWVLPLSRAGEQGKQARQEEAGPALHQEMVSLIEELRGQAAEPLPKNHGGPANDWLRRYDEHLNRKIQRRAEIIDRFAAIGRPAIPVLINALDDDTDYGYVARSAAEAIGKIADRKSIPLLLNLLKEGNDPERRGAVEALGNLKSEESVVPLVVSLQMDKDPKVRLLSAVALGQIGFKTAIAPLCTQLAKEEEDESVRAYAAQSLGRLGATGRIRLILTVFERSHERSPGGPLPSECELALRVITGQDTATSSEGIPSYNVLCDDRRRDQDDSVKAWRNWWERAGKVRYPQERGENPTPGSR